MLHVSGEFTKLEFKDLESKGHVFKFNEAVLNAGIDDLRGIEKQISLNWDGQKVSFNPGVTNSDVFYSGINAKVNISPTDDHLYRFSFDIELKGSQQLYFTPVGKETDVVLNSDWQTPKFDGAFLPDEHKTDKNGFKAHWNVLNLNRNYPQSWTGSSYKLRESSFGVDLKLPVDNYQKSHRTIHYALLFIGLTFLFSKLSQLLTRLKPEGKKGVVLESEWEPLSNSNDLLEAKVEKQILFGPVGVRLRRKDGVPSVLGEFVFGKKVRILQEGLVLEKWNTLDAAALPDFDICLYDPELDKIRVLTQISSFDWHLAEIQDKQLVFKWFDGTQGGEQVIHL